MRVSLLVVVVDLCVHTFGVGFGSSHCPVPMVQGFDHVLWLKGTRSDTGRDAVTGDR